jgi:hypothetical protein
MLKSCPPAVALALAFTFITSACADMNEAIGPTPVVTTPGGVDQIEQAIQLRSPDRQYWQIARRVPGFGGVYLESGTLVIVLRDESLLPSAQAALHAVGISAKGAIRSVKGKFDFVELATWRHQLAPLMDLEGVVSIGVDVRKNAVAIGVSSEAAANRVRGATASLRIPRDALSLSYARPIRPTQSLPTLSSRVRPIAAGYSVEDTSGLGPCTLGINARTDGDPWTSYFITASHCTAAWAQLDGGAFYQPVHASGNLIGAEVRDVDAIPCGTRVCITDVALIQYSTYTDSDFGNIAQTNFRRGPGQGSGSRDVWGTAFFTRVEGYAGTGLPMAGAEIDKMGITTGWTYGHVSVPCLDINLDPSVTIRGMQVRELCTIRMDATTNFGDSGGPVFSGDLFYGINVAFDPGGTYMYAASMESIISALNLNSFPLFYCYC